MSKYTNNSSKTCVLDVNLEHPQELHELNNDSPLTPDKTNQKRNSVWLWTKSCWLIQYAYC